MELEQLERAQNDSTRQFLIKALWLSYPIWGTILVVAIGCLMEKAKISRLEGPVLFLGSLGLLPSMAIILGNSKNHLLVRLLFFFGYAIGSTFLIFISGWMAICWFCSSCH